MMHGDPIIRKKLGEIISPRHAEYWWKPDLFEKFTHHQLPTSLEILSPPPTEDKNYSCFTFSLGLETNPDFLKNKNWEFTKSLEKQFDELIQKKTFEKKRWVKKMT